MEFPSFSAQTMRSLINCQRDELTGNLIYGRLARREKHPENREILQRMAREELAHASVWEGFTRKKCAPRRLRAAWFSFVGVLLGYTFVLRLLERDETGAITTYENMLAEIPEAQQILQDEKQHESELIEMLDEERLQYVGAMVLGLNDALVELSGTIAGLTFALTSTRLVALSGIITGVSATLSMAASNYLAERAENNPKALKSSVFTGVAYLITVALLVAPYLLIADSQYILALVVMLCMVVLIILFFNYYISVAQNTAFLRRFAEMAGISLSVAVISFVIGLLAKALLGVDVG